MLGDISFYCKNLEGEKWRKCLENQEFWISTMYHTVPSKFTRYKLGFIILTIFQLKFREIISFINSSHEISSKLIHIWIFLKFVKFLRTQLDDSKNRHFFSQVRNQICKLISRNTFQILMNLSILNILCTVWKKAKFSHTEKKIRQIKYIVICCEKRVRENFCNFHTVQLWKN